MDENTKVEKHQGTNPRKANSVKAATQEPASTGHKALTVVGVILCVILIPILVLNITLIAKSFGNKNEVPSIGGVFPMIVLTDSMDPEISSGDLIICHTIDAAQVKKGDIICFYNPEGNGSSTVTHRVIKVGHDKSGQPTWKTKGDANNVADNFTVKSSDLVGIYQKRIPGLGNAAMFMQTTQGLIICVICPIILLVAYDVIRRRKYEKAKQKDTDALLAELNALREEKKEHERK